MLDIIQIAILLHVIHVIQYLVKIVWLVLCSIALFAKVYI